MLRLGVNDPELVELDELLELDEPDDDELDDELDDEELDDEIDDEDDEDEPELLELDPPDPVVGAAGESPHAAVNPAAASNVPCDSSIRKSRRAFSVLSRSSCS